MKPLRQKSATASNSSGADEYERLVHQIVEQLCISATSTSLGSLTASCGRKNRILGASGYPHQIDVSLQDDCRLFLIECKKWKWPIDVSAVLTMSSRKADIAAMYPDLTVIAIIVSSDRPTKGAITLARHFQMELEIVKSANDFGMRLGRYVFHRVAESVRISGWATGTIGPRS